MRKTFSCACTAMEMALSPIPTAMVNAQDAGKERGERIDRFIKTPLKVD
jgi:hypothetical protein